MPLLFSDLAQTFDTLESTSSRKALTEQLAGLFERVSTDEVAQVSYLLQGRVAPLYEAVEFGLADKTVAAAIGRAHGTARDVIMKRYGQLGDLGRVAAEAAEAEGRPGEDPTVAEVFAALQAIAGWSGPGSQEKKVDGMATLLRRVDARSARHLVRIPLGTARLGVGDPTVLAAFGQAKLGDPKQRPVLEEAYNRTSDLGLIGRTLWEGGLAAVKALDVQVGKPIRPQLAERLPDARAMLDKMGGKVHVQSKFDGMRVQIHLDRSQPEGEQVKLFSRNLESLTTMFPEIVEGTLAQVQARTAILDAEGLAYNPATDEFLPFQETMQRRRKHKIADMRVSLPLKGMVFDVMYLDGESLLDTPLLERLDRMMQAVGEGPVLTPEAGQVIEDPELLQEQFEDALAHGLEGLVVKRVDSIYQAGARNFNWVKLKKHSAGALEDTIDCVLLGYVFGRGKRVDFGVGALLVGVYDAAADQFVTVSKVGTGLSDQGWRELRERAEPFRRADKPARVTSLVEPSVWLEPKIVIEILADEITRSPNHTAGMGQGSPLGLALRFPRFLRFRDADRRPEDATTVKELLELFAHQRGLEAKAPA